MFRVPLHMVQSLDKATNNNIEHQGIDFVSHTIRPWAVRFEQAADRDLIDDPDLFVQFKLDELQRGDRLSRFKGHQIGIMSTFMNPNEARSIENMNPREGGDVYENPNTTAGGFGNAGDDPDEPAKDDEDDEGGKSDNPFAEETDLLIQTVANGLADMELRAIRKRLKSFDGNGERFSQWLGEYYGEPEKLEKVVSRLMAVADRVDRSEEIDGTLDIDGAFQAWKDSGCESVGGFENWAAARHEAIFNIIRNSIE